MTRASEDDVRNVIDYDTDLPLVSMAPFIRAASTLVDKVESNDSSSLLTSADLKEIETWLAAHFYAHKDLQFKRSEAGEGKAQYQVGMDEKGPLNSNIWGKTAMLLDVTGYLADQNQQAIRGKQTVTLSWLGKPPSTQTDYVDRD